MNIYQLDELINSLDPVRDKDIIIFYQVKRVELVARLQNEVERKLEEKA
jgi:hypothetical protein